MFFLNKLDENLENVKYQVKYGPFIAGIIYNKKNRNLTLNQDISDFYFNCLDLSSILNSLINIQMDNKDYPSTYYILVILKKDRFELTKAEEDEERVFYSFEYIPIKERSNYNYTYPSGRLVYYKYSRRADFIIDNNQYFHKHKAVIEAFFKKHFLINNFVERLAIDVDET